MTARGVLGALIAAGAGLPFLPLWAALIIGVGAGLIVPLVQYLIEHILRLDDPTSSIATHGIPAVWGLLAVAVFADGHAGDGWNRISGTGVAGYLAATRDATVWPGQFHAQIAGALATFLTVFVLAWFLYAGIQSVTRAWRGEYTVRLPRRRPAKRTQPRRGVRRIGPRIHFVRAAAREAGQVPDAESVATLDRPKKIFDLSRIRSRSRDLWKGIIALLKDRTRAPTREAAPSTERTEPLDGDE
jgi:hypothetical protein